MHSKTCGHTLIIRPEFPMRALFCSSFSQTHKGIPDGTYLTWGHTTGGGEQGKGRLGGGDGWQRGCESEYPATIMQRIILVILQIEMPLLQVTVLGWGWRNCRKYAITHALPRKTRIQWFCESIRFLLEECDHCRGLQWHWRINVRFELSVSLFVLFA